MRGRYKVSGNGNVFFLDTGEICKRRQSCCSIITVKHRHLRRMWRFYSCSRFLKKNQTAPRPSEHPPVMGEKCQNV